jgi:hypothetical protein
VRSGRKDLSNVPPPGRAADEGLDEWIAKALREDRYSHLSTRKIAIALNAGSIRVQNHLTKSLGIKCCHMQWVPQA